MSIQENLFTANTSNSNNNKEPQKKSEFWCNIGKITGSGNEDGKYSFLNIPFGIPLDNINPVDTRSSNEEYAKFCQAQNTLLRKLMEKAATLKPGESTILNLDVQLVRRRAENDTYGDEETNQFLIDLDI